MKNVIKGIGVLLVGLFVAMPAYGIVETPEMGVPAKTLADFQRQYSDTKPVVAWHKYQEYQFLQNVPRPTLEPSRMRTETIRPGEAALASKPLAEFSRRHRGEETGYVGSIQSLSGTKPVVGFWRES